MIQIRAIDRVEESLILTLNFNVGKMPESRVGFNRLVGSVKAAVGFILPRSKGNLLKLGDAEAPNATLDPSWRREAAGNQTEGMSLKGNSSSSGSNGRTYSFSEKSHSPTQEGCDSSSVLTNLKAREGKEVAYGPNLARKCALFRLSRT